MGASVFRRPTATFARGGFPVDLGLDAAQGRIVIPALRRAGISAIAMPTDPAVQDPCLDHPDLADTGTPTP
jgi:hypothetical protein